MSQHSNNNQKTLLFVRNPKIEQMRNPLDKAWNQELASQDHDAEINLAKLIDFSQINDVFSSYLEVIGLPVAIIDFQGHVLASSNWQRVCMEFHRTNQGTLSRCLESDRILSREMQEGKDYAIYRCKNGLTDCAAPIVIEGRHIANLFIGQFFIQSPEHAIFEAQRAEFGFDHDAYFQALSEVPVVDEQKIPSILKMLVGFASQIAKQSLAEHRAKTAYHHVEQLVLERTHQLTEALNVNQKITEDLDNERKFVNALMNSQDNIVISTDGKEIKTVNNAFYRFFNVGSIDEFFQNVGKCICDTFIQSKNGEYLNKTMGALSWIEYVELHPNETHKVQIIQNNIVYIFTVSSNKIDFDDEKLIVVVFSDVTDLENIKNQVQEIHKHTRDSIEYASLIQHALIPSDDLFEKYFSDYSTIWNPKDIVGGDIYLFEELRNENECLLMVIDCTGHGVPGAFVTMLVKAIERQIVAKIMNNSNEIVSPAKMLSTFNNTMKHILKQENEDSVSNAGFDGAILYYNKKENVVRYSGSNTSLFYFEEKELATIKGDRHSIGYKRSDINFVFKEYEIVTKKGMSFYISTDGYLDQNGGEKGFPFGRKRFEDILKSSKDDALSDVKDVILNSLIAYQGSQEGNDDITVIGIKI